MSKFQTLFVLSLMFVSLTGLKKPNAVFVSKVPKNTINKFLNRYATIDGHLVVTRDEVPGALESKKIIVECNEPIFFVEANTPTAKNCLENICWSKSAGHRHGEFLLGSLSLEETTSAPAEMNLALDFPVALGKLDIPQEFLREKLMILSGEKEFNGKLISERQSAASKKLAREFLSKEFAAAGFKVSEQSFNQSGYQGVNLIAEKEGRSPKFWILSAHYDSMKTAGADDDATGIVTMLAVANYLASKDLEVGLKFVAFDLEEVGMVGSKVFAKELNKQNKMQDVMGDIQLEMTGYDPDGDGDVHIIDCDENSSNQITKAIERVVSQEGLALKKVAACTNRSDHSVFWEYGRPAIVMSENFFGGDGNPCYHRACDKVNKINFDYMRMISLSILGTVQALVIR